MVTTLPIGSAGFWQPKVNAERGAHFRGRSCVFQGIGLIFRMSRSFSDVPAQDTQRLRPSLASVKLSMAPVMGRLCADWKARMAALVPAPILPSIAPL